MIDEQYGAYGRAHRVLCEAIEQQRYLPARAALEDVEEELAKLKDLLEGRLPD